MANKVRCSKCRDYFNADELSNISLCNGQCWTKICSTCVIIVDQEILDIFENNTEITGYLVVADNLNLQKQLNDFTGVN